MPQRGPGERAAEEEPDASADVVSFAAAAEGVADDDEDA